MYSTDSQRRTRAAINEPGHPTGAHDRNGGDARGWIAWAAASVGCVLMAVLAVVSFSGQAGQASSKPSAEIYFSNSSNIPTWIDSRSLSFSFEVHNLASRTYDYRYEIYVTRQQGGTTLIADKTLTLGPQQRTAIKETITPPKSAKLQVTVSLGESANRIFFWTQPPQKH